MSLFRTNISILVLVLGSYLVGFVADSYSQNIEELSKIFSQYDEDSKQLSLQIQRFIVVDTAGKEDVGIYYQQLINTGTVLCKNFKQLEVFNATVLEQASYSIRDTGVLRNFYSTITRSTVSWSVTNSFSSEKAVTSMSSLAMKMLLTKANRDRMITPLVEGVFAGLNYASNRLYLDKSSLMASMIKGMGNELVKSDDESLKQAVVESFLNAASTSGKTKELVSVTNMLAKGFAASTVFHALQLDETSVDLKLTNFSSNFCKHVLSALQKNTIRTENDFAYLLDVEGAVEIRDLITGKKVPKAFTKRNVGIYEGYRITVNPDSKLVLALEDGSILKLGENSVLTFIRLQKSEPVQLHLSSGEMYLNQKDSRPYIVKTRSGEFDMRSSNTQLSVEQQGGKWVTQFYSAGGESTFKNNLNRSYKIAAGSYLKLSSNRITEKPVIDVLDPKKLYLIQNAFNKEELASSDIKEKLIQEASKVGEFRFNKRLGLVTYSLASGMATGIAQESSHNGVEFSKFRLWIKALAKGAMKGGVTFSTQNNLDAKMITELTAKGIAKGTITGTNNSGYKGVEFREKSNDAGSSKSFIDIDRSNVEAMSDEKLIQAAKLAEEKFLLGREVLSRLSNAMKPESERIADKISVAEKNRLSYVNENLYNIDIQKVRRSLEQKDINGTKIAIVPLLDAIFQSGNDDRLAYAKIGEVTSKVFSPDIVSKSEYIVRINIVASTISEYLMSRYPEESDLVEYIARLCNALSKSAADNALKVNASRTELVRNIAHAVSSPWMQSERPIETKVKVVKGVNYGLPYRLLNMALTQASEEKRPEIIRKLARESTYGIVSAATLDDEDMSEMINIATDAFSSSLITVASKNQLSMEALASLSAVASEGVMSGSIEALSANELPLDKLGAVMLSDITGNVRVEKMDTGKVQSSTELGVIPSVHQGYSILTGIESQVVLTFSNGTNITLLKGSRLEIQQFLQEGQIDGINIAQLKEEPTISQTRLKLAYGDMVFDVKRLNERSSMIIETPLGITKIKGTSGGISSRKNEDGTLSGGTQLISGQVEVISTDGVPQSITPGQSVSYSFNPASGRLVSGRPAPISNSILTRITQTVETQSDVVSVIPSGSFSAMVNAVRGKAKIEVTDKVAKVSAKVSKTVTASGVIALQKFGFGEAVEAVTQATAKGTALGAVKSALKSNLDSSKIAFQISRGTTIGALKEIATLTNDAVAEVVGEGHLSTLQVLKSSGVFSDDDILQLDEALQDGRNSVLEPSSTAETLAKYQAQEEESFSIIEPGQILKITAPEIDAFGNLINPLDGNGAIIELIKNIEALPLSLLESVDQSLAQNLLEFHEYTPVADDVASSDPGDSISMVGSNNDADSETVIGEGEAVEIRLPEPGALIQELVLDTISIDELPGTLLNAVSAEVIAIVESIPDYTPILEVDDKEIMAFLNLNKDDAILVPGEILRTLNNSDSLLESEVKSEYTITSPQGIEFSPESLDIFSDPVVTEILESAQVFTPITVAQAQVAEAQQIAPEGDTVSLMEAIIQDVSEGALSGILEIAGEAGIDTGGLMTDAASGLASGNMLGLSTLSGSIRFKSAENVIEGALVALAESGFSSEVSTDLATEIIRATVEGNLKGASEGGVDMATAIAATKTTIEDAITKISSSKPGLQIDTDSVDIGVESTTIQTVNTIIYEQSLDGGSDIVDALGKAEVITNQLIDQANSIIANGDVITVNNDSEVTSPTSNGPTNEDSGGTAELGSPTSGEEGDSVFDFIGDAIIRTFDPPLTTIQPITAEPAVVEVPVVDTTPTNSTPADTSPIN